MMNNSIVLDYAPLPTRKYAQCLENVKAKTRAVTISNANERSNRSTGSRDTYCHTDLSQEHESRNVFDANRSFRRNNVKKDIEDPTWRFDVEREQEEWKCLRVFNDQDDFVPSRRSLIDAFDSKVLSLRNAETSTEMSSILHEELNSPLSRMMQSKNPTTSHAQKRPVEAVQQSLHRSSLPRIDSPPEPHPHPNAHIRNADHCISPHQKHQSNLRSMKNSRRTIHSAPIFRPCPQLGRSCAEDRQQRGADKLSLHELKECNDKKNDHEFYLHSSIFDPPPSLQGHGNLSIPRDLPLKHNAFLERKRNEVTDLSKYDLHEHFRTEEALATTIHQSSNHVQQLTPQRNSENLFQVSPKVSALSQWKMLQARRRNTET